MLLYIDPGTGSMLFAAMIGIVSTVYFLLQQLWLKIKYRGGKVKVDADKKEIVIFGEGGQYWKVFKPVCDELEKRGISCEYYTMDENDKALSAEYKYIKTCYIGSDNKAFAKLNLMKAKVCLSTTPGLGVYQWKRSKGVDKYVHIFHDVGEGTGYRMFGIDDYDTILLTGQYQERYIRKLEELRNEAPKELKLVGCTYLDALWERKEAAKNREESDKGITVLLAPSWGETAILSRFGEKIIQALLKTGYHIIVRPHPQTFKSEQKMIASLMEKFTENEQLEWDREHDNFDSLNRADVMITDFSGVMFDYAFIFDKPIIYTNADFDKSVYDAAWIDEPVWRTQIIPDLGIELKEDDFDSFTDVIDKLIKSDKYASGRKKIGETAWQNRGEAAAAIADYLEDAVKITDGEDNEASEGSEGLEKNK